MLLFQKTPHNANKSRIRQTLVLQSRTGASIPHILMRGLERGNRGAVNGEIETRYNERDGKRVGRAGRVKHGENSTESLTLRVLVQGRS